MNCNSEQESMMNLLPPQLPIYRPDVDVRRTMLSDTRQISVKEITNYSLVIMNRYINGYYKNQERETFKIQNSSLVKKLITYGIKNMNIFKSAEDLRDFKMVKQNFILTYRRVMNSPNCFKGLLELAVCLCELLTVAGRIHSVYFLWDMFNSHLKLEYLSLKLNIYPQQPLLPWYIIQTSFNWRKYIYNMRNMEQMYSDDKYYEVLMNTLAFTYHVTWYIRNQEFNLEEERYVTYIDNYIGNNKIYYDFNTIWDIIDNFGNDVFDELREYQIHGENNNNNNNNNNNYYYHYYSMKRKLDDKENENSSTNCKRRRRVD